MLNKKIIGEKIFFSQIKEALIEMYFEEKIHVDKSVLVYLISESEENPSELFNFLYTEKNQFGDIIHKNMNIVNDNVFVYDVILN
jgi:hypothetical protein